MTGYINVSASFNVDCQHITWFYTNRSTVYPLNRLRCRFNGNLTESYQNVTCSVELLFSLFGADAAQATIAVQCHNGSNESYLKTVVELIYPSGGKLQFGGGKK